MQKLFQKIEKRLEFWYEVSINMHPISDKKILRKSNCMLLSLIIINAKP